MIDRATQHAHRAGAYAAWCEHCGLAEAWWKFITCYEYLYLPGGGDALLKMRIKRCRLENAERFGINPAKPAPLPWWRRLLRRFS